MNSLLLTVWFTWLKAVLQNKMFFAGSRMLSAFCLKRTEGRILVPDGWVPLVWNGRDEEDPAVQELKEVFRRFCPGFYGFGNGFCVGRQVLTDFFREGDPGRPALLEALSGLFGRYAENGVLLLKNRTQSCTGHV